jgi:hypothetical protein
MGKGRKEGQQISRKDEDDIPFFVSPWSVVSFVAVGVETRWPDRSIRQCGRARSGEPTILGNSADEEQVRGRPEWKKG